MDLQVWRRKYRFSSLNALDFAAAEILGKALPEDTKQHEALATLRDLLFWFARRELDRYVRLSPRLRIKSAMVDAAEAISGELMDEIEKKWRAGSEFIRTDDSRDELTARTWDLRSVYRRRSCDEFGFTIFATRLLRF